MSTQSFADLGVSRAVAGALSRQGVTEPFAVQRLVIGDVLAGPRRAREVAHRVGQDARLRDPARRADQPRTGRAPRPSSSRRPASSPSRSSRRSASIAHARALRVTAVYGGVVAAQAGARRRRFAHPRRHPRAAARTCSRAAPSRSTRSACSSSTRPTGCSTWASAPPSTGSSAPAPPSARRCSSPPRSTARPGAWPSATPATPPCTSTGPPQRRAAVEVEHRFVPVTGDGRVETLVGELARERDLTLVFVRTKRGADRLVKRLDAHGVAAVAMHGNKSQRQREQALARFESGAVDTLVATDVAARGIDVVRRLARDQLRSPRGPRDVRPPRRDAPGARAAPGVGITLVGASERHDVSRLAQQLGIEHGLGGEEHERETRPHNTGRTAPRPQRQTRRRRPVRA